MQSWLRLVEKIFCLSRELEHAILSPIIVHVVDSKSVPELSVNFLTMQPGYRSWPEEICFLLIGNCPFRESMD